MSKNTIEYYNNNAKEYFNLTVGADMSKQYKLFLKYLVNKGKILDFGCGSGRDALYFKKIGYDVDAIDGSKELCRIASAYTGIDVKCMDFKELDVDSIYDGIWACSSLVHVNRKDLLEILKKLNRALKYNGIIYIAIKSGDGEENLLDGRYYSYLNRKTFEKIIIPLGFEIIEFLDTKSVISKEEKRSWNSYILKKVI